MFILRDPRNEAWAKAASSASENISKALGRYIGQRNLQEAQREITPDMPLSEQLKIYQKHYVPLEEQERLTSPHIIQQQNLERGREALKKINWNDITPHNLPQKLAEITSALAGTGLDKSAGEILSAFAAQTRARNYPKPQDEYTRKGQPSPKDVQLDLGRESRIGKEPTIPQPMKFTTGETVDQEGRPRFSPQIDVPMEGPLTADDVLRLQQNYFNAMGTLEGSEKYVQTFKDANRETREFQLQNLQRKEQQRLADLEAEDEVQRKLAPKIEEDYTKKGVELPSYMRSWMNQLVMQGKGPVERNYRIAKQQIDNTIDRLSQLDNSPKRPWAAALREKDRDKYLRQKKLAVDQILNNPLIPAYIRKDLIEDIQRKLVENGDGKVDAEYMTNRPSPENVKQIESVGKYKPKTKTLKGTSFTYGMKVPEIQPVSDVENIEKLSNVVFETAGGMTSPLIIRNRWLDLGYTEDMIREAYALADERGAPFSDYQRNQIAELVTPERPSLATIAAKEETLRGLWDIFISGRR